MMKLYGFAIFLFLQIFMDSLLYSNDISIIMIQFIQTCHAIVVDIEPVYVIYGGIINDLMV